MQINCPQCKNAFKFKDIGDFRDAPMAVCPKCDHVFFIKDPVDDDDLRPEEQAEEKGIPPDIYLRSRQARRYLVLVMILFLVVVAYQISQYILSEIASNEIRDRMATSALKSVIQAQELYYSEHGNYADELEKIKNFYRDHPGITVDIDHANQQSWSGSAYHHLSPSAVIYDSSKGGIQIELEKREHPPAD